MININNLRDYTKRNLDICKRNEEEIFNYYKYVNCKLYKNIKSFVPKFLNTSYLNFEVYQPPKYRSEYGFLYYTDSDIAKCTNNGTKIYLKLKYDIRNRFDLGRFENIFHIPNILTNTTTKCVMFNSPMFNFEPNFIGELFDIYIDVENLKKNIDINLIDKRYKEIQDVINMSSNITDIRISKSHKIYNSTIFLELWSKYRSDPLVIRAQMEFLELIDITDQYFKILRDTEKDIVSSVCKLIDLAEYSEEFHKSMYEKRAQINL